MIVSHSFYVQALYDEYQSPVRALFLLFNAELKFITSNDSETLIGYVYHYWIILVIGGLQHDHTVRQMSVYLAVRLLVIDTERTNHTVLQERRALEYKHVTVLDAPADHGITVCRVGKVLYTRC